MLFTVIVPCTVTIWLPWAILDAAKDVVPASWDPLHFGALILVGMGVVVYLRCLWDMAVIGGGIPAPVDHPKRLVVRGLYRYVRNPMYLGVLCVLLGEAVFVRSGVLFLYTIAWFVIVQGVILFYEEPALRARFGPEYERYAQSVRRWLPGRGHENTSRNGDADLTRFQITFSAIVLAQAAHSVEEYLGQLWESFPPAQFLTGLISPDLRQGFLVINVSLVAFGVWCVLWPVRQQWNSAYGLAWLWVGIELVNGIGHPVWSLSQGGYTPGVLTAPLLLILALYMANQLRSQKRSAAQQGDVPDGASRRR